MNKERELAENDSTEMKEETIKSSFESEDVHLDQQDEHEDVTSHTKEGLLSLIQDFKLTDSISRDNSFLKEIKNHYDQLFENERDQALQKFIEDGGVEDDFDYKKDKTSQTFEKIYDSLKAKISQNYSNQEKEKEKNLQIKNELLERQSQKKTSKKFWSACKAFFNHKNVFFKQLEAQKEDNLKKKIQFCEQAEALKDSDDYKNTAQALKDLQKQWESVGPVPIKMKEEVFKRFKAACDAFFNKKREQHAEVEKEFVENLKMKISILEKIEKLADAETKDSQELKVLQHEWKNIGFVPRAEVKNINDRYNKAIEKYIAGLETLNKDEKDDLKMALQLAAIKGSPTADKKLHRKESEIHKRISSLRKEINQYNTNIDFLARSSKADKLRDEINSRIQHAENELKTLEDQLKLIKDA